LRCCSAIAVLLIAAAGVQAGVTLNAVERLDADRTGEVSTPSADSSRAKETSWTEYWKDESAQPTTTNEVVEPVFKPESAKAVHPFDHSAPVLIPTPTALWTGTIGLVGVAFMTQLRRVRRWFV